MTGFYVIGTSVIADQSSFHAMFPFHSPENICEQENCHVSVTMMLKFSTCQIGTAANNNFKSSQTEDRNGVAFRKCIGTNSPDYWRRHKVNAEANCYFTVLRRQNFAYAKYFFKHWQKVNNKDKFDLDICFYFLTLYIHNWIDSSFGFMNDTFLKFMKNFMDPKTLTKYTHLQTLLFSLRFVVP